MNIENLIRFAKKYCLLEEEGKKQINVIIQGDFEKIADIDLVHQIGQKFGGLFPELDSQINNALAYYRCREVTTQLKKDLPRLALKNYATK